MAERVPLASELSRIMERVACEVTRHIVYSPPFCLENNYRSH